MDNGQKALLLWRERRWSNVVCLNVYMREGPMHQMELGVGSGGFNSVPQFPRKSTRPPNREEGYRGAHASFAAFSYSSHLDINIVLSNTAS